MMELRFLVCSSACVESRAMRQLNETRSVHFHGDLL